MSVTLVSTDQHSEILDALVGTFSSPEGLPTDARAAVESVLRAQRDLSEFFTAEQFPVVVEAVTLYALAHGGLNRTVDEVVGRKRVYWQGNSDTTVGDVQIQKLVGELSTWVFAARSSITAALHSGTTVAYLQALVVAHSAVDTVSARLFDALGSSAVQVNKHLDYYWRQSRQRGPISPRVELLKTIGEAQLPAV